MIKTVIQIEGMHCRSCEILIEDKLKEELEVKKVVISYKKEEAEIYSEKKLDIPRIEKLIIEAGYQIKTNNSKKNPWFSKNPDDYKDLFFVLIILVVLTVLLRELGVTNLHYSGSGTPSSLIVVLVIGLVAGVSTCMALVGGLILSISARYSEKHPEATPLQKFRPHLFFNFGRIASFTILGGLIGLIGKSIQFSSLTLGILIVLVGVVMLILGLQLVKIFPKISRLSFTLPTSISRIFGLKRYHQKEYSHLNSVIIGAISFFLPCGFTQAMQLYAISSGSFYSGAAIMGIFALGTTPGLLGLGGLTSIVKGTFARLFFTFAGVIVIILAIFNISNGLNLAGVSVSFNRSQGQIGVNDPNVKLENGVQIVTMIQTSTGYKPNKFTITKNIPVKWIINSQDPNSCAASIVASKIKVQTFLVAGENIITFTPTEKGEIKFTCSMGMYTGKFIVVDGDPEIKPSPNLSFEINQIPTKNNFLSETKQNIQLISTTYVSSREDIQPKEFIVKANKLVRLEIKSNVEVVGCMGSIALPGLTKTPQFLKKDEVIAFEFTPTQKGDYYITCSMGTKRGKISVI